MKQRNIEEVGALLRDIHNEFGERVEVTVIDPRAWILSFIDMIRYNVKVTKPVWIIDGKKFYEGIPTKEELYAALS